MRILLTLMLLLISLPSYAQELSYKGFSDLPVLHEGRVKPMDSFARIHIQSWADEEHLEGHSPSYWLAKILFDPQSATDTKFFLIRNTNVKEQFGLAGDDQKYYSLQDLLPGIDQTRDQLSELLTKDQNTLTADQREFLDLHENVSALSGLMRSFSLLLPLDIVIPDGFKDRFEGVEINYLDLMAIDGLLVHELQNTIAEKGEDLEKYNEEEKKIALLSFQIQNLRIAGETSTQFKVIPASWDKEKGNWHSPWELILSGQGSPEARAYLQDWKNLAAAYRNQDAKAWDETIAKLQNKAVSEDLYEPAKFTLERYYNSIHPYTLARGFYGAAILWLIFMFAKPLPAYILASFGALAHTGAIASRVIILDRPPVGTLYESVLFVSLICVVTAVLFTIRNRNSFIMLSALIAALVLLAIAPLIVPDGENLEVLVAVLNTNFWLATHVTIITAGYGICLIAACLAHFYLYLRIGRNKNDGQVLRVYNAIYKTSIAALLFTAVGTVLGGIWADQSWGRFWGWDPKENGALLIVLWLIWIQHGRLAGKLKDVPFMAGVAYLNVIVAVAWFGVNLLGVGLHSYGFTSGLAIGLGAFCAFETLFIGALWILVRTKNKGTRNVA